MPFVRLNVLPDANSTWLLPRLVGLSRALELMLTGRWFTGREAADIGLASRAVPADEVLPAAQELAHEIAAHTAPLAVGLTKHLVYKNLMEADRVAAFTAEGVTALLGRRTPQWTQSKHTPLPDDLPER
jgi:enoyl-CoA hydratase/carnithine racemase